MGIGQLGQTVIAKFYMLASMILCAVLRKGAKAISIAAFRSTTHITVDASIPESAFESTSLQSIIDGGIWVEYTHLTNFNPCVHSCFVGVVSRKGIEERGFFAGECPGPQFRVIFESCRPRRRP